MIEIADKIFIIKKDNYLYIDKYGQLIQIGFDDIYISLEDAKPSEDELERKISEGKVIHISTEQLIDYAFKLELLKEITDDDLAKVFDVLEKYNALSLISLTDKENEIIDEYDSFIPIIKALYLNSKRFKIIIDYLIQRGLDLDYLVNDFLDYLNNYSIKDIIIDYIFFDDLGKYSYFREKYGFNRNIDDMKIVNHDNNLILRENSNDNYYLYDIVSKEDSLGEAIILKEKYPFPEELIVFKRIESNIFNNPLKDKNLTWNLN